MTSKYKQIYNNIAPPHTSAFFRATARSKKDAHRRSLLQIKKNDKRLSLLASHHILPQPGIFPTVCGRLRYRLARKVLRFVLVKYILRPLHFPGLQFYPASRNGLALEIKVYYVSNSLYLSFLFPPRPNCFFVLCLFLPSLPPWRSALASPSRHGD